MMTIFKLNNYVELELNKRVKNETNLPSLLNVDFSLLNKKSLSEIVHVVSYGYNYKKRVNVYKVLGLYSGNVRLFKYNDLSFYLLREYKKLMNSFRTNDENRSLFIKHMSKISNQPSYRKQRLILGYPMNGQKTRSNARTSRKLNKRRFIEQ